MCIRRPRGGDRPPAPDSRAQRARTGRATRRNTKRIGRASSAAARGVDRPAALDTDHALSNTTGPVLDPIVSLRQSIRIPPGGTARVAFTTGFADNEDVARQLIEKYHDRRAVARALALASTHSQIELRHLGLTIDETLRFQRLAGRLMYGDPRLRAAAAVRTNTRGQPELWKYGISGDVPILLLRLEDESGVPLYRDLLKAHEYLRRKGMAFDLVVLNEHASSYLQDLQNTLLQMVESGPEQSWVDRPGGVFLRRADLMPPEDAHAAGGGGARRDGRGGRQSSRAAEAPADSIRSRAGSDSRGRRVGLARVPATRVLLFPTTSSCSTASAGSPTTGASTSSPSIRMPAGFRPAPGRTSSRTRRLDSSPRSAALATRGLATATRTG